MNKYQQLIAVAENKQLKTIKIIPSEIKRVFINNENQTIIKHRGRIHVLISNLQKILTASEDKRNFIDLISVIAQI